MGRSRMNCMKITLHLLALCLLLSITTKVSGKPNPRHLLIETEEQAKKTADYNKAENNYDYQSIQNIGNNQFTNSQFNNNQMNAAGTSATQNVWGNPFTDSHINNVQTDNSGDIVLHGSKFNTDNSHW